YSVVQILIAQKPEELIFNNLSTGGRAVLFQANRHRPSNEIIGGIPWSIASKCVRRSVQAVGSRFHADVLDRAVPPAVFRLRILLDIELLNGIDRQKARGIALMVGGVQDAAAALLRHGDQTVDQRDVLTATQA